MHFWAANNKRRGGWNRSYQYLNPQTCLPAVGELLKIL